MPQADARRKHRLSPSLDHLYKSTQDEKGSEVTALMSSAKRPRKQDTELKQTANSTRHSRLEVSLRANLQKRKEQARQRQEMTRRALPKS